MAAVTGRKLLIEFIDKYRELECLWKANDKDYRNKPKRLTALKQLLQIMKRTDPNANIDTVTKKINSLRSSFNKEYNKVKASCRSGTDTDDLHVPKLWYYDLLLFLVDRGIEIRKSSDNTAVLCETKTENENFENFKEMEPPSPCCSQNSTNTNLSSYSQRSISRSVSQKNNKRPKKKLKSSATKALTKIAHKLDINKSKQKYSAFGEHVAEKLRDMEKEMAIYCEKLINDAIFYAECGKLSYSSHIVTESQPSDPIAIS